MTEQLLHLAQIVVSVLTSGATALLGLLFWNASLTNSHPFTKTFLKLLSVAAVVKGWEIISSAYRTSRIAPEDIPLDATIMGLQGRFFELVIYAVVIWFMLRPETKRALNGGPAPE